MGMRETIDVEMRAAMKAREQRRLSCLRMMKTEITRLDVNAQAEGKKPLEEAELQKVVQKMVKQRQDAAKEYKEAGRAEQAQNEELDIPILETFLPKGLSDETVSEVIKAAIAELGAAGTKDMGRVMKVVREKLAAMGPTDGGKVSALVKAALGG